MWPYLQMDRPTATADTASYDRRSSSGYGRQRSSPRARRYVVYALLLRSCVSGRSVYIFRIASRFLRGSGGRMCGVVLRARLFRQGIPRRGITAAAVCMVQELHFVHHWHANSNFAVIHFFWDRILGTYKKAGCWTDSDKWNASDRRSGQISAIRGGLLLKPAGNETAPDAYSRHARQAFQGFAKPKIPPEVGQ